MAFFLAAFGIFGAIQVWRADTSALNVLDDLLEARAKDMARGPGRGGPGPNQGGPGAGGGQGGPIIQRQFQAPIGSGSNGQPAAQGQATQGQNPPPNDPLGQGPPNGQNGPGAGRRFEGPNPPSIFRRPVFLIKGDPRPIDEEIGAWWPEAVSETQKGRVMNGFATKFGVRVRVASVPIPRPDGEFDVIQVAQEADTLDLARSAQIAGMVSAIPAVALIAIAFSLVLSRFVVKPVSQATDVAEKLAADPKAKERIPVKGEDEMARLSTAFNSMTDRMQDANVELERSLERQRQFTSDAAHEFRTPLTSIALAAENALHTNATPEELKASLDVIQRSSGSLARMTELLLSLSRLDASHTSLPTEAIALKPLIQEAIGIAGLANDPRIQVEIEGDKVHANADAVRQIVSNLLINAAAHTPDSGSITIRQKANRLEISDTGEGIAAEHLPRIFERFYRADPSRTKAKGGHGLGLAICKSLAEAQRAAIGVESKIGEGTTFFIDFSKDEPSSSNSHFENE